MGKLSMCLTASSKDKRVAVKIFRGLACVEALTFPYLSVNLLSGQGQVGETFLFFRQCLMHVQPHTVVDWGAVS